MTHCPLQLTPSKSSDFLYSNINYMKERFNLQFPVLMGENSPLFNPIPWLPADDYRQKNRRFWSKEEINQLAIDEFGIEVFDPTSIRLIVSLFEPKIKAMDVQGEFRDDYQCGRVIKIGNLAFSSEKFIAGPPCTYGDYIVFNSINAKQSKLFNGEDIIMIEDVSILGTEEDPSNYYKFKPKKK